MIANASVLTTKDLKDGEEFAEILKIIRDYSPELVTGRWGIVEPLEHQLTPESLDEVKAVKNPPLIWRSGRRRFEGSIWRGSSDRHSNVALSSSSSRHITVIGDLTLALSRRFSADFAFAHILTDSERADDENRNLWQPLHSGISTHTLREGLPAPACITIWGEPYAELFGRDRLLDIPAGRVEKCDPGLVVLRLSELNAAGDLDYAKFSRARNEVMNYLGREYFRGVKPESEHIPDFGLEENPRVAASRALWDSIIEKSNP